MTPKEAEVRRLLDRYLIEIVEAYGLCPWAKSARTGGEVSVAILWGQRPEIEAWVTTARTLIELPTTRVAMVLAPELGLTPNELRVDREQVGRALDTCGVADFHPDVELDTATPARLVPFVRRAPDPLLQFVPLKILDVIRRQTAVTLSDQARALGGIAYNNPDDIGDEIAATNHERVLRDGAEMKRLLDDIATDRRRSYPDAGIAINTIR
jgi:hypothetical protein